MLVRKETGNLIALNQNSKGEVRIGKSKYQLLYLAYEAAQGHARHTGFTSKRSITTYTSSLIPNCDRYVSESNTLQNSTSSVKLLGVFPSRGQFVIEVSKNKTTDSKRFSFQIWNKKVHNIVNFRPNKARLRALG